MKLLLVTDAWHPQINGAVNTLAHTLDELKQRGHTTKVIHPGLFPNVPCPKDPEIRLAFGAGRALRRMVDAYQPDAIHIAIEGPLGLAARRLCISRQWSFTTSYHTRFPEYLKLRFGLPLWVTYLAQLWYYRPARRVMVATPTIDGALRKWGFKNTVQWARGVDTARFRPIPQVETDFARPIYLYVGRVAIEKNLQAFLQLEMPGTKLIVGDGPARPALEQQFPDAVFVGSQCGEDLVNRYAQADVFVFPSRTDTFGLVLLEALASGVPIAAFPVPGPLDVIGTHPVGVLNADLKTACQEALRIPRARCREFALQFSWSRCADLFESYLEPISGPPAPDASKSIPASYPKAS